MEGFDFYCNILHVAKFEVFVRSNCLIPSLQFVSTTVSSPLLFWDWVASLWSSCIRSDSFLPLNSYCERVSPMAACIFVLKAANSRVININCFPPCIITWMNSFNVHIRSAIFSLVTSLYEIFRIRRTLLANGTFVDHYLQKWVPLSVDVFPVRSNLARTSWNHRSVTEATASPHK